MALKSAYDDLLGRTLSRIQGAWGQLRYLAELRSRDGRYSHWGFERVHGANVAQSTFSRAHKTVMDRVLRSKLGDLEGDLRQSSDQAGINPQSYASSLKESLEDLLPAGCPAWSRLHLLSILQTLAALEFPGSAHPRSSSLLRRPGRSLPLPEDASAGAPEKKTVDGAEEQLN